MQKHEIVPNRIITVENFLTAQECADYIRLSENIGFEEASITTKTGQDMRPDIRNNSRVVLDDAALSSLLWERIEPFVPSPLFGREPIGLSGH